MSMILKGIDLPKGDTAEVIIRIQPNGEVRDSHGILLDVETIQIPKGHGRLIDRSVLLEEYQNLCNGLLCRDCPFFNERNRCNIEEWILNQPTILEAEE